MDALEPSMENGDVDENGTLVAALISGKSFFL